MNLATQRVNDYLVPQLGARDVRTLRRDDVRAFRLTLERRGLAPLSVRHILSDVRCFLGWCVESGALEESPFPRRVMPRIQETPPDRLTDDEVRAVAAIPEPQAFVVRLGLLTGLRWGELTRARAEDVQDDMLLVHHTKAGRLRRVPLAPRLQHELRGRAGRLVPYAESSPGSFGRFVQRHSRIRRFHVHQLRHTFACHWLEAGGGLATLQLVDCRRATTPSRTGRAEVS